MNDTRGKSLNECGNELVIEKNKYRISIDTGTHLLICAGFGSNKAGAKFTHPNILATRKTIHEFKHENKNGRKNWTRRAGINHYIAVPYEKVFMLKKKGYSYVYAEINGVTVRFNVSGGGCKGWTDVLHKKSDISVNHKLADLKKLVEVAVRDSEFEGMDIPALKPERKDEWNLLTAKGNTKIKKIIARMIDNKLKPKIILIPEMIREGETLEAIDAVRGGVRVPLENDWYTVKYTGAIKLVIVNSNLEGRSHNIGIRKGYVDWYKTAKANQSDEKLCKIIMDWVN